VVGAPELVALNLGTPLPNQTFNAGDTESRRAPPHRNFDWHAGFTNRIEAMVGAAFQSNSVSEISGYMEADLDCIIPREIKMTSTIGKQHGKPSVRGLAQMLVLIALLHVVVIQVACEQGAQTPAVNASGQVRKLMFGTPVQRDLRSGDVDEFSLAAGAGDLVSGKIEVRRLAALVEILNAAGTAVHTDYSFEGAQPVSTRIGFVAPATGTYRLRIKAFDRFNGGPQWAPGELAPIVGTASGSYTLQLDNAPISVRMLGVQPPVRVQYPSLRLQRLTQDLQAGRDALNSFWQEVAGKGPIVEEIPDNNRDVDVTFLWREIYDTRNVLLVWCPKSDDCYMSRLPGTDVWYKTVRLRRGSRIVYGISPNDRADDRWATEQLDPLNPHRFPDDPTYHFYSQSVLETPGAPDEQWALRPPVRRGAIEQRKITSAILGGERDIWIYTPPSYTGTGGPYPLLLLLDGATYVSSRFENAPGTLDNLINDGRIRPVIVCFDPANRGNAVLPAPGTESKYGRVVAQELMPMLRTSYPISADPKNAVIGGFSAGGRAAAEIAFFHPDMFGNVLSQSGTFCDCFQMRAPGSYEPNLNAQAYLAAPRKPIRFYLEVGLYDGVPSADLPVHELTLDETDLMGNRHLRDVLRAKGYDVTYREVGGGHDFLHWRAMLADGLMALLGK